MMAALTSINPPNTDNIFDGVKWIEWRTKPLPTGLHYCYETKNGGGVGMVIGEFTVWRVKRYESASRIPETEIELGCVPKEFLMAYSKGKAIYANYITNPKRYDHPMELSAFVTPSKIGCCNEENAVVADGLTAETGSTLRMTAWRHSVRMSINR